MVSSMLPQPPLPRDIPSASFDRNKLVDVESAMEEYLDQRDWRVNANANQGLSLIHI